MSAVHPVMEMALRGAAPEIAAVSAIERGYHVDYRLEGTFDQVLDAIRLLFKQYHPLGYSTRVHDLQSMEGNRFVALVTRAKSCD